MTTDTIIQIRSLVPGDDLVYTQIPTPQGLVTQETNAEDSWDLAEEQAKQAQANDLATAGSDDESSSSSINTINGPSNDTSDESSDESSSNTSSSSASASTGAVSAAAGTTSTAATASTARTASTTHATSTASSGANRMTAAVPANASLRATIRDKAKAYHLCAGISTVLLAAGVVFTLMAQKVIPHRDSGYVYPEEIELDKIMAGLWYAASAIAGGIGIANAVYHYRRGNN